MNDATSPWVLATEPATIGDAGALVTLVAGQGFCVCGRAGDVRSGTPQGIYFADTRVVSEARLAIDGDALEPLAVDLHGGWGATFVARPRPAHRPRQGVLVLRHRALGLVAQEEIEVRNHTNDALLVSLRLDLSCDFADLFAVKEDRVAPRGERTVRVDDAGILHGMRDGPVRRQVRYRFDGGDRHLADPEGVTWQALVPPKGHRVVSWTVSAAIGEDWAIEGPAARRTTRAAERFARWRQDAPALTSNSEALEQAVRRSIDDLGSLRLFDPTDADALPVIAAGAPWFMALFGRDALLTALMALPVDPSLALGVLRMLARTQGTQVVAATEEEPGRILHETRFEDADALALDAGRAYYGSVDATPLFVVVLGALSDWGLPETDLRDLLPHADRALEWVQRHGDRDGDGYVEYERSTDAGLANQGWKDSWDGIRHHDGRLAQTPIALCEVQGYAYAAHRARARMARRLGDEPRGRHHDHVAAQLRARFDHDFWCPELGWYAMGLDGAKRRIDALASNMGHCLWSGIAADERIAAVASRLFAEPMWTGFGIRTMAADEPAFDPLSYHCGSVWPHDNALIALGLARTGRTEELDALVTGLLDAASAFNGRLPELFCGLDRRDVRTPVPFPTSCSPQAWAAAAPLALLRAVLGLEVDVPAGVVRLTPHLPPGIDVIDWRGVRLFDGQFDVCVRRGEPPVVEGLPDGLTVV